jgi:hypothetical protein
MARKRRLKVKEHQLYTVLPSVWKQLKRENRIDRIYRSRARRIENMSRLFSFGYWLQDAIYREKIHCVPIEKHPPLFILGIFRSGTTHLHYALARDPQFGYLTNHQAFTFNMSLLSGDKLNKLFDVFVPSRRPQDNVKLTLDEPAEEEQPFSTMTTRAAIHSFFFPRNESYFRKYHLFEDVSEEEKEAWKGDYLFLLKNIALYSGKNDLVLKNPHNTGRVKELLEMFPGAKFIFIHRHPETVFRSMKKLYNRTINSQYLQFIGQRQIERTIIEQNALVMHKYLRDRLLIPKGNLVEIAYTELEENPMGTIERIYDSLGLGGLPAARPAIEEYLDSVKGYKKNRYRPLHHRTAEKLRREWAMWYGEWGYTSPASLK